MQRLTTTSMMILAAAVADAQDIVDGEAAEVRSYTVEVIIFEYAEDVSVGTEVFVPEEAPVEAVPAADAEALVFGDREPETQPDPGEAPAENEDQPLGPEFILHIEDEFTMTDIASRLERLDVYEPIMHFAWTQTTLPQEETIPIDLPALAETPEGLTGSFALYLSRYLHLVVDLTLDERPANGEPVAIEESVMVYGDDRSGFGYFDLEAPPVRFRIQENRIFKNGDLRYFDHPKFGVLAKITRVEEEDEGDEVDPGAAYARELVGSLSQ